MTERSGEPPIAKILRQMQVLDDDVLTAKITEYHHRVESGEIAADFAQMLVSDGLLDEGDLLAAQRAAISGSQFSLPADATATHDKPALTAHEPPLATHTGDDDADDIEVELDDDDLADDADDDDGYQPTVQNLRADRSGSGSHTHVSVPGATATHNADDDADDYQPTVQNLRADRTPSTSGSGSGSGYRSAKALGPNDRTPGVISDDDSGFVKAADEGSGTLFRVDSGDSVPIPTQMASVEKSIVSKMGFGKLVELEKAPQGKHERFGRYFIVGRLGRGGMGDVLNVRDPDLNRDIALKVTLKGMNADRKQIEKFLVEAQVTGQLEHPNIPPLHELGLTREGQAYFTMKYVRGRSLKDIIGELRRRAEGKPQKDAAMPDYALPDLLDMFTKICDGVAFAHAKGVVHRDLKPENVMVGEFGEVMVMDWGLAKVKGVADKFAEAVKIDLSKGDVTTQARGPGHADDVVKTLDGTILGTPMYMPPEQAHGEIDEIDNRSDIYSLGAILYELLTLQRPIEGATTMEILMQVAQGHIVPLNTRQQFRRISPELEAVVMKAMAQDKKNRYQTVQEFQKDIRAFLAGHTLSAVDYSLFGRFLKFVKRNRVMVSAAAAVVIVAVGVFVGVQAMWAAEDARKQEEIRGKIADHLATADSGLIAVEQHRSSADYEGALKALETVRSAYDQIVALETDNEAGTKGRIDVAAIQGEIKSAQQAAVDRANREAAENAARAATERKRQQDEATTAEKIATAQELLTAAQTTLADALPKFASTTTAEHTALQEAVLKGYDDARNELAQAPLITEARQNLSVTIAEELTEARRKCEDAIRLVTQRINAERSIADAGEKFAVGKAAHEAALALMAEIEAAGGDSADPELRARADAERGKVLANLLDALNAYNESAVLFDQLPDGAERSAEAGHGRVATLVLLTEQSLANREYQMADFWLQKAEDLAGPLDAAIADLRATVDEERLKAAGYESAMTAGYREFEAGNYSSALTNFREAQKTFDTPKVRDDIVRTQFFEKLQMATNARQTARWRDAIARYAEAAEFAIDEDRRNQLQILNTELVAQATADLLGNARAAIDEGTDDAMRRATEALDMLIDIAPANDEAPLLRTQVMAKLDTPYGFVYVPAGRAALGHTRPSDRNPERIEELAAFYIATREVTVAEFREFVAAGGYSTREFWSDAGWEFVQGLPADARAPANWADQTNPAWPVTGVSAFEAMAYAAWRSAAEESDYRLPSDAEWELVARHLPTDRMNRERRYPWGTDWTVGALDLSRGLEPVGSNPRDRSAFGCLDMGGSVSEWVLRPDDEGGFVGIRGANVYFRAGVLERFARVTKRGFAAASERSPQIGFRLARQVSPK